MQGDFTWDPFNYRKDVSRVLIQQGRVQLDSDANEQTESLLRFLRGLGRDLIGPHGGVNDSFHLVGTKIADAAITRGEYYVDGIRCLLPPGGDYWEIIADETKLDARNPIPLGDLPNYVAPADGIRTDMLFYLDVFERHVSSAEDDSLLEVALLGADTASRAVITWRLRTLMIDAKFRDLLNGATKLRWPTDHAWYLALNVLLRTGVRMRAKAARSESTDPCIISPEAGYRGAENRLVRVEVHDAGDDQAKPQRPPTFKWSEDNGSIVYPIRKVAGATIHLGSLGRDARTQICVNDWVEVVDDDLVVNPRFHKLLQVVEVNTSEMTVILSEAPGSGAGLQHPILRRWASDLMVVEWRDDGATPPKPAWIDLTDGVQVEFSRVPKPFAGLRPGDYWLIPTRTANGALAWPMDGDHPRDMPPNGVDHHYAPIATADAGGAAAGATVAFADRRLKFAHLAKP